MAPGGPAPRAPLGEWGTSPWLLDDRGVRVGIAAALAWRLDAWLADVREQGWLVPNDLPEPPRDVEP